MALHELALSLRLERSLLPLRLPRCSRPFPHLRSHSYPQPQPRRSLSTQQTFRSTKGSTKVNLEHPKLIGIAQSRGERPYQEDAYQVISCNIRLEELRRSAKGVNKRASDWAVERAAEGEGEEAQVTLVGVFDGHGTDKVSRYLRDELPTLLESIKPEDVPELTKKYREIGGYLRRFKGGLVERLANLEEVEEKERVFGLDERLFTAFLKADQNVMNDESIERGGSVATLALLHSLTHPSEPFFSSSHLLLTLAHIGDTRALLCATKTGRATLLTETHHADSRVEAERLRRVGTGLVTDSFGETRWGGALENTRGIGDREFKRLGVTGEVDTVKRVVRGDETAFMVLVSDGIAGSMSDQEIVDLCRGHQDPSKAAHAILSFAEDIVGTDNMTCLVVPFQSWGKVGGTDVTAGRREFRTRQAEGQSLRQRRM